MPHQVDSNIVPHPNLIEHFSILSIRDNLSDIHSSSEKSSSTIHDEHYHERKISPTSSHPHLVIKRPTWLIETIKIKESNERKPSKN
jgi:hypothetical protein